MDSNRSSDPAASWLLSPLGQQATGSGANRWLDNAYDTRGTATLPTIGTIPELGIVIDFTNRTVSYDKYSNLVLAELNAVRGNLTTVHTMVNQLTSDIQVLKSQIHAPELRADVAALEEKRDKLMAEISELNSRVDIEFLTSLE